MMKPGASWREEPYWHWSWPYDREGYVQPGSGVQHLSGHEQPKGQPVANLYVSEAESPTGWRDFWVYREPPSPPPPAKMGF